MSDELLKLGEPHGNKYVAQYREIEAQYEDYQRLVEEGLAMAEVPWQTLVSIYLQLQALNQLKTHALKFVPTELRNEALRM